MEELQEQVEEFARNIDKGITMKLEHKKNGETT
jgi:hypothetical protein